MRRNLFKILCVGILSVSLWGCSDDDDAESETGGSDSGGDTGSDTATSGSDTATETESDTGPFATQSMLERSLVSAGNNYRMKQVLGKVASNEPVTIAYIGGSITEGYTVTFEESYVVSSYEKFVDRFAGGDATNVHYFNGGMGGTPSTLGMLRYEPEVVAGSATPPDVVFVEFAVNDYDDSTYGASYESLVRKILMSEGQPAVILLFSVFRDEGNLEDRLRPVGTAYQLPMISIKEAVVPELHAGTFTKTDFFRDAYHPTAWGFQIMAETIDYYFEQVALATADASDIVLPDTAAIGYQFADIHAMTPALTYADVTVDVGSFTDVDSVQRAYSWSNDTKRTFEQNWHKETDTTNAPFTLTGTWKNLALAYKVSSDENFGTADVYVDGVLYRSIKSYASTGWNQPVTVIVMDEEVAAPHTFELKMAAGDEAKFFTIDTIGYTP